MSTMAAKKPNPPTRSIMRSLGEFFGHIAHGVRSDPTRKEVRRTVEEEERPDGIILRRTTIEEIEIPPKPPAPNADAPARDKPSDD